MGDSPKSSFGASFSLSTLIQGIELLLAEDNLSLELKIFFSFYDISTSILLLKPPDLIIPKGLFRFF